MRIREARLEDAEAVCDLLRRSITELCRADHNDDRDILANWLHNKTPENIRGWIMDKDNYGCVAEDASLMAVGAITGTGVITLNYVAPEARFKGASRAILGALETRAKDLGLERCTLESTITAHQFYVSAGYREREARGAKGIAMTKLLRA